MYEFVTDKIRELYQITEEDFLPLHAPIFAGREQELVTDCIDSTFVSSVGQYVNQFEQTIEEFTGASKAIATVNGTAALHAALHMAQVGHGDIVLTQALTFVATCNAIAHLGAEPAFIDVCPKTLGLCPEALNIFLTENTVIEDGTTLIAQTRQPVKALVVMHTFGHPAKLDELAKICSNWHIELIEDAAEALGSFYKRRHVGTTSRYSVLSFNGNKVITTGGGGMILCNDKKLGEKVKHLTTTAKVSHPYEFYHDEIGFNYRMPNLNAALGCAQMEYLQKLLEKKRMLAKHYSSFFENSDFQFVNEPEDCQSNFWLNAIICPDKDVRDSFLEETNKSGVMTRPVWTLMHKLPAFKHCHKGTLTQSEFFEQRIVNIPSGVPTLTIDW